MSRDAGVDVGRDGRALVPPEADRVDFASIGQAIDWLYNLPWSDGLPLVPATDDTVARMVQAGGRQPDQLLGELPQRRRSLAVWQAATCAVMAGCRPEYFPLVLTTWDAMFDPRFNLHSVLSSSGGAAVAAIVSGPYAREIGMNSSSGLLSPGNRANATIGRAIRLAAMSALDALPGLLDASSFGQPAKFTFHFAEAPCPPGWLTVPEQLGFASTSTTVTVMAAASPRQINYQASGNVDLMLETFAESMRDRSLAITGRRATYMFLAGPEHAGMFAEAGYSQAYLQGELAERSKVAMADLLALGWPSSRYEPDRQGRVETAAAEHILIVPAGGPGAGWSIAIPAWAPLTESHPVTRALPGPTSNSAGTISPTTADFA